MASLVVSHHKSGYMASQQLIKPLCCPGLKLGAVDTRAHCAVPCSSRRVVLAADGLHLAPPPGSNSSQLFSNRSVELGLARFLRSYNIDRVATANGTVTVFHFLREPVDMLVSG